jgi:hypothetical protein
MLIVKQGRRFWIIPLMSIIDKCSWTQKLRKKGRISIHLCKKTTSAKVKMTSKIKKSTTWSLDQEESGTVLIIKLKTH